MIAVAIIVAVPLHTWDILCIINSGGFFGASVCVCEEASDAMLDS